MKRERNKRLIKEEKLFNIPNSLTLLRVILTFFIFYLIIGKYSPLSIVVFFVIAALTDFLDGQIARRWRQQTEFGRKFDMIADRFLMIGTVFVLLINWSMEGILERKHILQIFLITSREIVSLPFALLGVWMNKDIPKVRFIGKLTTFLQGFAFPIILLSISSSFFDFSIYLSWLTGIIGIFSAITYIRDLNFFD